MKRILERWARNRVVLRSLSGEFGKRPIFVSPDSALSYLKPNWTASFSDLFRAVTKYVEPGQHVWDIGANLGAFTLAAAHVVGEEGSVLAVEADPFLASLIQRTANHPSNQNCHISVLCCAISDQRGIATFSIATRGRSSSGLAQSGHRSTAGGTRYQQPVPTFRLDELLEHFPSPKVIKVDVEGAEELVLRGSTRLLREIRPTFYIEVGYQQGPVVAEMFRSFDYKMYNGDSDDCKVLDKCAANTLAVPAESTVTN